MQPDKQDRPTFVNEPTRLLVEQVFGMIQSRHDWRQNANLCEAYEAFDEVCRREPAIIGFIRRILSSSDGCMNVLQIQLFMLATLSRSSSSYGTIPELVVLLNLAADYGLASKINDNAVHEAGTSKITSHPQLLLNSFSILSESIRAEQERGGHLIEFPPLTQASFALVRQIHLMREAVGNATYSDIDGIIEYIASNQIYCPSFTKQDLKTAIHYCSLCDGKITSYHSGVLGCILGLADRGRNPSDHLARRDPTDRGWLATQAFEFCTREASSADVGDDISYVGAYGLFAKALLGYVPESKREMATKWWWVHSDADVGKSLGWGTTAELGHAEDARELVARLFEGLSVENAETAIRAATSMSRLRLRYWEVVTERLIALGDREDVLRIPFRFKDYQPLVTIHTDAVLTNVRFDSHDDALVIEPEGSEPLSIRLWDRDFARVAKILGLTPDIIGILKRSNIDGKLSIRFDFTN
jgi:hypothetical protein